MKTVSKDVVIVGGGPAGTAVAYALRDQPFDVVLLEENVDAGGRTRSVPLGGGVSNTGAMYVYRGTETERLVKELGLPTIPVEPTTCGIHFGGVTAIGATNEQIVAALPLTQAERSEFLGFLEDVVREYHAFNSNGQMLDSSQSLADATAEQHFSRLSPRIREIVSVAVRGGAVGGVEHLSAQYALRYFASHFAHETNNRLLLPGGMQSICKSMIAKCLPEVIMTRTRVGAIENLGPGGSCRVSAMTVDGPVQYVAKQVVIAIPAPQVRMLYRDLPDWKTAAINELYIPGALTMSLMVDVEGCPEVRKWYFVTAVGTEFDLALFPAPGQTTYLPTKNLQQVNLYASAERYRDDFVTSPELQARWLEDFYKVAPQLRGRVQASHAAGWKYCFAVVGPNRTRLLEPLRRPIGSIHFAGDWTSETAGSHGAFTEGQRVATEIRQTLERIT